MAMTFLDKLDFMCDRADVLCNRMDAVEEKVSRAEIRRIIESASKDALYKKLDDPSVSPEGRKMIERELDSRANSGR